MDKIISILYPLVYRYIRIKGKTIAISRLLANNTSPLYFDEINFSRETSLINKVFNPKFQKTALIVINETTKIYWGIPIAGKSYHN